MQLSQLPQRAPGAVFSSSSPKYASSIARRQLAVSQSPSIASSFAPDTRLYCSLASDSSIMRRSCTTSCSPYAIQASDARPSRPARPVSW